MNYFNIIAIMLVSIGMGTGWGENTYSDVWEYFEIKWISMACILVGKAQAIRCFALELAINPFKRRLKIFQTTSLSLACKRCSLTQLLQSMPVARLRGCARHSVRDRRRSQATP